MEDLTLEFFQQFEDDPEYRALLEAGPLVKIGPIMPNNDDEGDGDAPIFTSRAGLEQRASRIEMKVEEIQKLVATLEKTVRSASDPCRNPDCEFRSRCPLRPIEQGEHAENKRNEAGGSFELRPLVGKTIGVLRVSASLPAAEVAISEAFDHADDIAGLLSCWDCGGGSVDATTRASEVLRQLAELMPVVAFVRTGLSAGMLSSAIAHHLIVSPDAILGGFGVKSSWCDGWSPMTIVSTQSPLKRRPNEPPKVFQRPGTIDVVAEQTALDRIYEADLKNYAKARNRDPEILQPMLDGRTIQAEGAVAFGLADEIGNEQHALDVLVNLIHDRRP